MLIRLSRWCRGPSSSEQQFSWTDRALRFLACCVAAQALAAGFRAAPAHALTLHYLSELTAAARDELDIAIVIDRQQLEATERLTDERYFGEIARAQLRPWRERGITRQDLEAARAAAPKSIRYQIVDGQIYRDRVCYIEPRCAGVEHFLRHVAPEVPDVDLIINVRDSPMSSAEHPLPILSFSTVPDQHGDMLYPAWAFWAGGPAVSVIPTWRWDITRQALLTAGIRLSWREKKPVVFFRGSRTNASRDPYVLLGTQDPTRWDVRYTLNQSQSATRHVTEVMGLEPAALVAPADHCAYKYLLNFDGVAASFRLRNLLACGGLVLYVTPTWREFFYERLIPWVHYVPLQKDPHAAQRTLTFLAAHDAAASAIAANGRSFVETRLTMQAIHAYWRSLLIAYGQALRYAPARDQNLVRLDELHSGAGQSSGLHTR